jgi:hypothetical protein
MNFWPLPPPLGIEQIKGAAALNGQNMRASDSNKHSSFVRSRDRYQINLSGQPRRITNAKAGLTTTTTGVIVMAKSFSHIGTSAVYVLARLAARNAIKEKLRGEGVA